MIEIAVEAMKTPYIE